MKSLVTGSTGFIGSHLVELLLTKGHHVICLVRPTSNLRWLQKNSVELHYGDISNIDSLIPAVKGVDYVFHLSGIVRAKNENDFYKANYQGTVNLLKACEPTLKKFIFISSQAAAGPSPSILPLKETAPALPVSVYGKSKLMAEEAVISYQPHFPVTIIRPPGVYGPRDDDILEIFRYVKWGVMPLLGMKDKFINLIHVNDLVEGILLCCEKEIANNKIYFLANEKIYSILDIETAIANAMGKKAFKIRIPEFIMDLSAFICEYSAKLTHRVALVNRDKVQEMKKRFWLIDSRKAKKELGFTTKISLENGIKETLLWYRQMKWL